MLSRPTRTISFMALVAETTPYGRPAAAKLAELIHHLKAGDPLAPVTVVAPTNACGLASRRALAIDGEGIAAVNFIRLYDLAERLVGAKMAHRHGRRPLSDRVLSAAVRNTLAVAPGLFEATARHPATEQALVSCYKELKEIPDPALDSLASQSSRAADAVRICRTVRSGLKAQWYDGADLIESAIERIESGDAALALAETGHLIVYLPQSLTPSQGRLIAAIADSAHVSVITGLTGNETADAAVIESTRRMGAALANPPSVEVPHGHRIVSAADADEEVRIAVQEVVSAANRGIALGRIAVLCGGGADAVRKLHEHLEAADIGFNGPSGRTLADSLVGRGLIALLQLEDRGFRRRDVFALLSASMPLVSSADAADIDPAPAPVTAWERVSRRAGVAQGAEQWAARLGQFAADLRDSADDEPGDGDPDLIEYRRKRLHRDAAHADSLARFTDGLIADLTPDPPPASWKSWRQWVAGLTSRYLGDEQQRHNWPDPEREAAEQIESALDRLAELDEIEPNPAPGTLRASLLAELAVPTPRLGKIGQGVFTGRIGDSLGIELDRLILVGMAEGVYPHSPPDDPLLPDRERKAAGGHLAPLTSRTGDLHRNLLAALASAGQTTLVYARGDSRRGAEQYPSRWLLDSATALAGRAVDSPGLESFGDDQSAAWFEHVPSFSHRLANASLCASAQEHRLQAILRQPNPAEALWGDEPQANGGAHWLMDDEALRNGSETVAGRASDLFTRFDGNLSGHAIPDPGEVSPTSLEAWADCPMRYFFQRVLGVQSTDSPEDILEISALDKGSLVHKALEEFLKEQLGQKAVPAPGQAWSGEQRARLSAIGQRLCGEAEREGLTGTPVFWHHHRNQILADLDRFLTEDDARRRDSGATPIASEMGFGAGGELAAIPVGLPNGKRALFRGQADRVDAGGGGQLLVTDYKTGKAGPFRKLEKARQGDDWDPVQRGTRLQLPVYGLAARAQAGDPGTPVRAQYWFVSAKESFKTLGFNLDDAVLSRFTEAVATITEGIESGVFCDRPQPDKTDSQFSQWCDYCNPDRLGTSDGRRAWERKQAQPELSAYRDLCEPVSEKGNGHGTAQ